MTHESAKLPEVRYIACSDLKLQVTPSVWASPQELAVISDAVEALVMEYRAGHGGDFYVQVSLVTNGLFTNVIEADLPPAHLFEVYRKLTSLLQPTFTTVATAEIRRYSEDTVHHHTEIWLKADVEFPGPAAEIVQEIANVVSAELFFFDSTLKILVADDSEIRSVRKIITEVSRVVKIHLRNRLIPENVYQL